MSDWEELLANMLAYGSLFVLGLAIGLALVILPCAIVMGVLI